VGKGEWQPSPELRVREEYAFDPLTGRSGVHYTYSYADGRHYEYDARKSLRVWPSHRAPRRW
jgi:hypothetical protein